MNAPSLLPYRVDDREIAAYLRREIPPLLADLVDVAIQVHMYDRMVTRSSKTQAVGRPSGSRMMDVLLPVREMSVWRSESVRPPLTSLLNHLTGDVWDLQFTARPKRLRLAESQLFLSPMEFDEPPRVSLYSGGLDSFAGLAAALDTDPKRRLIGVAAWGNSQQRARQQRTFRALRALATDRAQLLTVHYSLPDSRRLRQEASRRSRGFMFLALGAVVALQAGAARLSIFENGVGALNLPYDASTSVAATSLAVHPLTLGAMQAFVEALCGRRLPIVNESWKLTKAEMCSRPAVQRLAGQVAGTFSCDSFPLRVRGTPQCGICTSCLLRRQALLNAGLASHDSIGFQHDIFSPHTVAPRRQYRTLDAYERQVELIGECLEQPDPWMALAEQFPSLLRVQASLAKSDLLTRSEVALAIVRLYSAHVAEWRALSQRAQRLKVAA